MKPYPDYKPSGVAWLGDVPGHWEVVRLRFRVRLNPVMTRPLERSDFVSFLPMEAIGDDGSLSLEFSRQVSDVSSGYTYFEDGDITIAKITPCFENGKGAAMQGLQKGAGFGTTELIVMRPSDSVVPRWLYFLTMCQFFREPGEAMMLGAGGQKRVPELFVKDYEAAFPPLDEQQAIADHLDTETARIDALVQEKLGLVELLEEARQSFVSGLLSGENLPGSLSGNGWVPHLPHGWTLRRLKHLAKVRSGIAKGKDTQGQDTVELPYLRVANVQDGHLDLTNVSTIEVDAGDALRCLLQAGDVLMNEGGDHDKVGRGALWSGEVSPCLHQNHVFAVRPFEPGLSEWLASVTLTRYAKFYFMNNAKQSTNLASISQTNVKELPVLLPPPAVRAELLQRAKSEAENLDTLILHTQQEIALLQELRAATIADAVLGRVDLRRTQQVA